MDNIANNKRIRAKGITIDSPRARDLDDAFWLEEEGDGYILHVSIADVGYNIKADSFFDIEAKKRCFTRYLKHTNLPMFPHKYSEGLLSLLYGENRPAITISIPINSLGDTKTPTIRKTFLQNKAKLSYEKASLMMESPRQQYNEMLRKSHDLAQLLFRKRRKNGAITIYSLHNRLATTEEGLVKMISPEEAFNSHILIQEFMILTNRIIAVFFANNNIPGLFRNHTSKAISPDRNMLLRDVNNVINLGDIGRIETLVERFALIFNKAEYSPIIKGHFSLNLPAYMHITSPIRRFADLINIRQLSAFISNKKLPYSTPELVEIAKHINDVAHAYKEEKNEYFKGKDYKKNLDILNRDNYSSVESQDFYHLLKTAIKEDVLSKSFYQKIESRLINNEMEIREMFVLLLGSHNTGEWLRLKTKVLQWLVTNSHHTTSILMMATQKFGWTRPLYQTEKTGDDHALKYTTIAKMNARQKEYVSGGNYINDFAFSSKKSSIQFANLDLLGKITGVDLDFTAIHFVDDLGLHDDRIQENNTGSKLIKILEKSHSTNYIGKLTELCQKYKWPFAEYKYIKQGSEHEPVFIVTAELTIDDKKYCSNPINAINKKQGKQLASGKLIEKISHLL